MHKEKDIIFRVTSKLKETIQKKAEVLGLSVSSYIRMVLLKDLKSKL